MKWYSLAAVTALTLTIAVSCKKTESESSTSNGSASSAPAAGPALPVHRIDLPRYQSEFPDATGREVFASSCLSCHSTSYVAMQPPLTAEKWEAEVRKMQKTYGAPISEEEIKPIVAYLMAVKEGTGPHIRESLAAAPNHNALIPLARDPGDQVDDAKRGEAVFTQYCISCHGTGAHGDGPAGLVLLPRPADLTAGTFSEEGVSQAVCNGIPGTAMASFGKLDPKAIRFVESYVISLVTDNAPAEPQSSEIKPLYLQNCAACHGVDGRGDGLMSSILPRPPANFHWRRPNSDYAKQVISDGVPGTAMPSWKSKLTDSQRSALAEYVRGFFNSDSSK